MHEVDTSGGRYKGTYATSTMNGLVRREADSILSSTESPDSSSLREVLEPLLPFFLLTIMLGVSSKVMMLKL